MIRFAGLLFLWLPIAMAADTTYTPCTLCLYQASSSKLAATKVRLYTGEDVDTYTEVESTEALSLFDQMDVSKPTVVYTHGLYGTPSWQSTKAIIDAYLQRGEHNVLYMNWANIAVSAYVYAARSVPGVGYTLATILNEWVAAGLNSSSLHLVGHSMGAEISGYAGRYANFTVPRIVGLDPAGPLFYTILDHINTDDADFVQVIHSDDGVIGLNSDVGHVDFYPNGGTNLQPGCGLAGHICSHLRACFYYAESVRNESAYVGQTCDSYRKFKKGSCDSNEVAVMGYATPTTASGKYYFQTNSDTPYGRGVQGTTYDSSTNIVTSTVEDLWEGLTSLFG
ncbi:phospholipase A1 member A-like isoform X1 [Neodiprion pinetum]|uniref:phospholipase A1 member A-like isoform X1 n=1 Tax=Neodiprion pinetum TaxID=441929 RepID=UPI001EDEF2A4|nr:phospholipase A1 member A-like isoform X1 [Neodiprion pinetum]